MNPSMLYAFFKGKKKETSINFFHLKNRKTTISSLRKTPKQEIPNYKTKNQRMRATKRVPFLFLVKMPAKRWTVTVFALTVRIGLLIQSLL